ncbi:hypothetical protein C8J56DRAFT_1080374 [Mycena floridula]|nr:hypothetical protein C8J56DRAFT_1080374 [Mycena floridula]
MTYGVGRYGWPSRVRGDFGKENNGVERRMIAHQGELHRAYLRGRSTHNIRMERTWRDVREDSLEVFRQIFTHLDDLGLLDMQNDVHRISLYIVFQPHIQASLERTRQSWNVHDLRTEHHKTPLSLYELSRAKAINRGYWSSDPGDDINTASAPGYGREAVQALTFGTYYLR